MKSIQLNPFLITGIAMLTSIVSAQTDVTMRQINPFDHLGTNALNSVSGYNIIWHTGGIAATYVVVCTDLDRNVHNYFYENINMYDPPSVPAVYLGYFAPLILGSSIYASGIITNNMKNACAGSAVLQSAFLAFIESSMLKAFTGRQNPDSWIYTKSNDRSNNFKFGLMRNGIHYGWPSGHMSASTAVVSCLAAFYCDNRLVQYSSWVAWVYMFAGVTVHEGNTMHWFSDVIAGSMMGCALGSTVGKDFRNFYQTNGKQTNTNFSIRPLLNSQGVGLYVGCKL
jgi:membrane-associated phospholipid phosphatase